MARPELGTKRACPETGKNFYDLGKEPIVSPYTGIEYPLSFFEETSEPVAPKAESDAVEKEVEVEADSTIDADGPEFVTLDDVAEEEANDEDIPDIPDVDVDVDDGDTASDDTFLEDDDEDTDLSDVIGAVDDESSEQV